MNRRDFLKLMGIGAAGIAAPKLIFDIGANSRIYAPLPLIPYAAYAVGQDGVPIQVTTENLQNPLFKIGFYQPSGDFWFGPGFLKLEPRRINNEIVDVVVASSTSIYPVGSIY